MIAHPLASDTRSHAPSTSDGEALGYFIGLGRRGDGGWEYARKRPLNLKDSPGLPSLREVRNDLQAARLTTPSPSRASDVVQREKLMFLVSQALFLAFYLPNQA